MHASLWPILMCAPLTCRGNNLPDPKGGIEPPLYRTRFVDGAQMDAFSGASRGAPSMVLSVVVVLGSVFVLL